MNSSPKLLKSLNWTIYTIRFASANFLVIFSLGLIAAFGRAIQLKAFGPISPLAHTLLEVVIESARISLFFFALGLTNIKSGLSKIREVYISKTSRRGGWQTAIKNLRENWLALVVNLVAFSAIAFLVNALINHIAYETCLYITLRDRQFISTQSSVWTLILFFKNISVIPFTLIFEAVFLLWITNRLPKSLT